jgi:hypothetical protein
MKKSHYSCCTNVEYRSHSHYRNIIRHSKILCKSRLKTIFFFFLFEHVLLRLCNENGISIPRQYIYIYIVCVYVCVCICVCVYIYIYIYIHTHTLYDCLMKFETLYRSDDGLDVRPNLVTSEESDLCKTV